MQRELIKGIVDSKIFAHEQSGYGIFRIALLNSNQKPLTVKGPLATIQVDTCYEFEGFYVEDERFGLQFQVDVFKRMMPEHRDFIVRFLSGPNFPGIGQKTAETLVDTYGESIIAMIREDQEFIPEIKGLSIPKAKMIADTIRKQDNDEDMVSFLLAHGLSQKQVIKIDKTYGDKAITLITDNPYRLVFDVDGIGFKTADKVAQSLNFPLDHPSRMEAILLDTYKNQCFGQGDSYLDKESFLSQFSKEPAAIISAYESLIKMGELVEDEGNRLYHKTQFDSEVFVASFLSNFKGFHKHFILEDIDAKISNLEETMNLTFDALQREAMKCFFEEDVMILTGGPGTGKSTLLSGIVGLIQANCPWHHVTLCAPTGRAAKRLEELTNVHAATIHSVLKWDLEANKFGMNELNPLETDILILDEFSMVDTWLLANLLKASKNVKKIMFVGDKDQLPSVGPGFLLGDMITSHAFTTVILERNYRQEAGSEVIDVALAMNQGIFDVSKYDRDVIFFDPRYGSVKDVVVKIVSEALSKGYDIHEIQVLAPMYQGLAGIDNLNYFLQKLVNPPSPYKQEIKVGTRILREGDKILQLKNQPDDFVFNGDIGTLVSIDNRIVTVDFDGNYVEYEPQDYIKITHAYAMSVHKAQGSEYPIVILIAMNEFHRMLSRRLYYTGATRSSKSLILVGQEEAFQTAVKNHHESKRNTHLVQRLYTAEPKKES